MMSSESPPSNVPDPPASDAPGSTVSLPGPVTVRQSSPVPKELSRSAANVIVERTAALTRKLTVLNPAPERPPVPTIPKRKVVVKSTKLTETSYPGFCSVSDVQLNKKTAPKRRKPPVKAKTDTVQELDLPRYNPETHSLDTDNHSPQYSESNASPRSEKAALVRLQREKRKKQLAEERLAKKTVAEEKKKKLQELRQKQLKLVQNNVKKAKLRQQTKQNGSTKKNGDEQHPQSEQEKAFEAIPQLDLQALLGDSVAVPESLQPGNSISPVKETIQTTEPVTSPLKATTVAVIENRRKETEELQEMVSQMQREIENFSDFLNENPLESETSEVNLLPIESQFEALHPNVTHRIKETSNNASSSREPDTRQRLRIDLPYASEMPLLEEELKTEQNNNAQKSYKEDPLVTELKNTLQSINMMKTSTGSKENNSVICNTTPRSEAKQNDSNAKLDSIERAPSEDVSKTQETAVSKIQAALRHYKADKLENSTDANKNTYFSNSEEKSETKSLPVAQPLLKKREADWRAAKYPSSPKTRRESDPFSELLRPVYLKPCPYNVMEAIQNTMRSKSRITQPYWFQANRDITSKVSESKSEPIQTVPVIDASKQKPSRRISVQQFLRGKRLTPQEWEAYLATSDEESIRGSSFTENSDSEDGRMKRRKSLNLKAEDVLPDRFRTDHWNKSEIQIEKRPVGISSRKSPSPDLPKALDINIKPSSSTGTASPSRKIKHRRYRLRPPNVELRRRNERSADLPPQQEESSDTTTWNSHQRNQALEEQNKKLKEVPVAITHLRDGLNSRQSHSDRKQRAREIHDSDSDSRIETDSTNQVHAAHQRSPPRKYRKTNDTTPYDRGDSKTARKEQEADKTDKQQQTQEKQSYLKLLHPTALQLQFQAEMNRLDSLEVSTHHLTALEAMVTQNIQSAREEADLRKRERKNLDKEIEVRPVTVESSVQTASSLPSAEDKIKTTVSAITQGNVNKETSAQSLVPNTSKEVGSNKPNFSQTDLTMTATIHPHTSTGSVVSSDQVLCNNKSVKPKTDSTQTEPAIRNISEVPQPESTSQEEFVHLNSNVIANIQIHSRPAIQVDKLLQETEQTRKTIAHALNMEEVARSIRRDDEMSELNQKFTKWDIEHMSRMNRITREDNQLFQRLLLGGGSSLRSTERFVSLEYFQSPTAINNTLLLQEQQSTHDSVNNAMLDSKTPQDTSERYRRKTVQSVLQQKLQQNLRNTFTQSSDKSSLNERDEKNAEHITDASPEPTSHTISETLSDNDTAAFIVQDVPVSIMSDVTSISSCEGNNKVSKIKESLLKIDKLIAEEKENAQKHVNLLNEKFLHLRERTKAEIKLLRVKIRELKGRGQENLISTLKERRISLLNNLEEAKKNNVKEHEILCKATADRKRALKQQKAIIHSFLRSIQSRCRTSSEGKKKKHVAAGSNSQASICSTTNRRNSSVLSQEKEKESKESYTSEPTIEDQKNISFEATDSHPASVSLKERLEIQDSVEMSSSYEGSTTKYSPRKDPVPEVCNLEDRVKTLREHLQQKKNAADRLWREQQKKKEEHLRIKEQKLLKQIQAYDDYIDKLKKELEESMDSSMEITMQSTEVQPETSNDIPSSKRKLVFQDKSDDNQLSSGNTPQSLSREVNTQSVVTLSHRNYEEECEKDFEDGLSLKDSEILSEIEGALEDKSEIITEIEDKRTETENISNEFSEFSQEVSGIIDDIVTDIDKKSKTEGSEQNDIPTDVEENQLEDSAHTSSEVVERKSEICTDLDMDIPTEIEEKLDFASEVEEKSQIISETGDKSEVISQTELKSLIGSGTEQTSPVISEVELMSHSSSEIEPKTKITPENKSEITTQTEGESQHTIKSEEKSDIQTEEISVEQQYTEIPSEIQESFGNSGIISNKEESVNEKLGTTFDLAKETTYNIEKDKTETTHDREREISCDIENGASFRMGNESVEMAEEKESPATKVLNQTFIVEETEKEEDVNIDSEVHEELYTKSIKSDHVVVESKSLSSPESLQSSKQTSDEFEEYIQEDFEEFIEEESVEEELPQLSSKEEQGKDIIPIIVETEERPKTPSLASGSEHLSVEEEVKYIEEDIQSSKEDVEGVKNIEETLRGLENGANNAAVEVKNNQNEIRDVSSEISSFPISVDVTKATVEETQELEDYESDRMEENKRTELLEKANRITDAILIKLLSESLFPIRKISHSAKSNEESSDTSEDSNKSELKLSSESEVISDGINIVAKLTKVENLTNVILDDLLNESTKTVCDIKKNRTVRICDISPDLQVSGESASHTPDAPEQKSTNVRKRVHEILAESNAAHSPREKTRPQEYMVTAYDVLSPEDTPSDSPQPGSPKKTDAFSPIGSVGMILGGRGEIRLSAGADAVSSDGFTQEWFDEDFGLSTSRREAEELRLQQLQIEQEIQQLQQLEQAQEQLPYYHFREIPNKPPPPYTPPGTISPPSKQETPSEEEGPVIPCRAEEIKTLCVQITVHLHTVVSSGGDVLASEPPPGYYDEDSSIMSSTKLNSRKMFKKMVFDLTRDTVREAYGIEEEENTYLPWEWPAQASKRRRPPPKSKELLEEIVKKKVIEHFDSILKAHKDKPVTRWSRKKRDFVDEILVKESHNEEIDWTNYDEDELAVKNEITDKILQQLMDETVQILAYILHKKRAGAAL